MRNELYDNYRRKRKHRHSLQERSRVLRSVMNLSETDIERFWAKVKKTNTCWIWQASRDKSGYGRFWANGKSYQAHRVSFTLSNDKIPKGMLICHTCDNPGCVKGGHLQLGDAAENARQREDRKTKARYRLDKARMLEIKALYENSEWTQAQIADRFGVSASTIRHIIR